MGTRDTKNSYLGLIANLSHNLVLWEWRITKMKKKTQAQLKKELDRVFSIYIRSKYPKVCYTCGATGKTLQNGHFVSRSYLATRFEEDNCRPQCVGCNLFGGGKPLDFEEHLKKELGAKRVEEMKKSRHKITILTPKWYEDKVAYYKGLIELSPTPYSKAIEIP